MTRSYTDTELVRRLCRIGQQVVQVLTGQLAPERMPFDPTTMSPDFLRLLANFVLPVVLNPPAKPTSVVESPVDREPVDIEVFEPEPEPEIPRPDQGEAVVISDLRLHNDGPPRPGLADQFGVRRDGVILRFTTDFDAAVEFVNTEYPIFRLASVRIAAPEDEVVEHRPDALASPHQRFPEIYRWRPKDRNMVV